MSHLCTYVLVFMGTAAHEVVLAFGSNNPSHHGEFLHYFEMQVHIFHNKLNVYLVGGFNLFEKY